jgi:hypothetical protein
MKVVLCIFSLILSSSALADAVSDAAIRHGQKALFSYPVANRFRKDTEKYLFSFLPIEKNRAIMFGGIGMVLVTGNVSTRNFKNLRVNMLGWNVAPEINFNTRNGQMFALVGISKDF